MSDNVTPSLQQGATENPAWLKDGKPDWSGIGFEVLCSRCGYELRMLEEPRCPECGLEFSWPEVLQRTANRSPWLFEHQWRKRPVRSWLQTVRRSLWPRQFWSQVSIHDVIAPGPLWFLLLAGPVLAGIVLVAGSLGLYWIALGVETYAMAPAKGNPYGATSMWIWMFVLELIGPRGHGLLVVVATGEGVLLATVALISSLRQTLGRCRVRPVQTLRVVAYAAAPACLAVLGLFAVVCLLMFLGIGHIPVLSVLAPLGFFASCGVIPMVYLAVGLRHYLRLTHARSIAIVSVLVAYLFVLTVAMAIETSKF